MIYAVLETPVTKQITSAQTLSATYLSAIATPYKLGATSTNFTLRFGSATINSDGNVLKFKELFTQELTLTAEQLATWGSDDTIAMGLIAAAIGATVTKIVSYVGVTV